MSVRAIALLAGPLLAWCAMVTGAQATMLVAAEGDVRINTGDGFKAATGVTPLRAGDTIEVGHASAARLLFSDGCGYSPAPGTQIVVSTHSPCYSQKSQVAPASTASLRSGYYAYVIHGHRARPSTVKRPNHRVAQARFTAPPQYVARPPVTPPIVSQHTGQWQVVENECPQEEQRQPTVVVQQSEQAAVCGVAVPPATPASAPGVLSGGLAGGMSATTATLVAVGGAAIAGGIYAVSRSTGRPNNSASP